MLPDPLENFGQSLVATSIFQIIFFCSQHQDIGTSHQNLNLYYTHGALVWKNNITFYFHCYFCSHGSMSNITFFIIIFLAIVSFILSELSWYLDKDIKIRMGDLNNANFYLIPFPWEILIGLVLIVKTSYCKK